MEGKLIILAGILGVGFISIPAQTFTDITSSSGAGAIRSNAPSGFWASGVSLVDLDHDGSLDYFISSHGGGTAVSGLNNGSGHFGAAAGTYPTTEIHAPYDITEDGKLDLTMTYQDGGGQWWINHSTPGSVSFSPQGINWANARQQAIMDINRDGKVDWLIGVESRATTEALGLTIEYGTGSGGFYRGSKTINLPSPHDGVSPMPLDLDNDGDQDLVLQWGRYEYEGGRTRVYQNDGSGNFTDITTACGLYQDDLAILGYGDYDNDGDLDLIGLENSQYPHSVFLNDGTGRFTKKTGAINGEPSGGPLYPGWGVASLTDFDNDGVPDVIISGRMYTFAFRGTGGGNFTYMNSTWGISSSGDGNLDNSYAFGDIDHDGDLDLAVHPQSRVPIMYRNDLPAKNWLNVRPVGLAGNRGAMGTKIRIYAPGTSQLLWYEEVLTYCKQAQQNYYAYDTTERHYGLGTRNTVDVEAQFYPSAKVARKTGVSANQTVVLDEKDALTGIENGEQGANRGEPVRLEANPNPFNFATALQFSVHRAPYTVLLEIFNTAGKCMAVLANGPVAPGAHTASWNASAVPAGVYLVRLRTGNNTVTTRLLLVK